MARKPRDTGDLLEVPDADRLEADGGEASDASEGGDDATLDHLYAQPGPTLVGPLAGKDVETAPEETS